LLAAATAARDKGLRPQSRGWEQLRETWQAAAPRASIGSPSACATAHICGFTLCGALCLQLKHVIWHASAYLQKK